MLQTLAVQNYRTLRDLVIELGPLNLITGFFGMNFDSLKPRKAASLRRWRAKAGWAPRCGPGPRP